MVLTIHTVKCASLMMTPIFFCLFVIAAVKRLSVLDNGSRNLFSDIRVIFQNPVNFSSRFLYDSYQSHTLRAVLIQAFPFFYVHRTFKKYEILKQLFVSQFIRLNFNAQARFKRHRFSSLTLNSAHVTATFEPDFTLVFVSCCNSDSILQCIVFKEEFSLHQRCRNVLDLVIYNKKK